MRCIIFVTIAAAAFAISAAGLYAQETQKGTEGYKPISPAMKAVVKEGVEAQAEYDKALENIKQGNDARTKGDDATAYCMYGEAIFRLNNIAEKYPSWNKDLVQKQLKSITDVTDKLTAATCKNLEEMREAQFRLGVWQRQVLLQKRMDDFLKRWDKFEEEWDQADKYIKDIRDRMFEIGP